MNPMRYSTFLGEGIIYNTHICCLKKQSLEDLLLYSEIKIVSVRTII